jgi:hypothetical protein
MSALGQKQTYAAKNAMSALHLIATAIADSLKQTVMSALPLKADMCGAIRDVRFGPEADIGPKGNYPRLKNTKGFTQAEPKEQKFLWLNRSSEETRSHHVYSAIDSGFISSVHPNLASRIDPNG